MKQSGIVTACLAAWMAFCGQCAAIDGATEKSNWRTFYVDSQDGRDDADGRSERSAWQSLNRVNEAGLRPGDTVRFRSGGRWRGSLRPAGGDESAPVTYTSYGDGPKPLLLGSVPRSRPEDWIAAGENVWATLQLEYRLGEQVLDLRQSEWGRHQEAGASVAVTREDAADGRIVRFACTTSGEAPNHVQAWGPELRVEKGDCLALTLRARSSVPFRFPKMALQQGHSPWQVFGRMDAIHRNVGREWETFQVVFHVDESAEAARLHINLGGVLPGGAVFEFQPRDLRLAAANMPDPLTVDVGNIIFDHGEVCGWKKWSVGELEKPYDYYYDGTSDRVFLYIEANPATLHESIELALKRHVVDQGGAHHVVYDGLAVMYGAAHGFGGGGTHHLVIRNCDLGYIGGGHQLTRDDGVPVRYGNAIEFWGAAHDNLVEGCRIWQVYDAALTNQGRGPESRQVNITYRNNFIRNSEYSFEYWNNPETALTENIRFVNNTCVDAGVVWSHAQRPNPNGSHLMFYSNTAATSGIEIKDNVFCGWTEWGSRYDRGWNPLPEMDYNLWFSPTGVMAYWFREKLGSFEEYRETTGLDPHSRFADPKFVDPAGGDYRLAPDSPARSLRPDGGPVGAEELWR